MIRRRRDTMHLRKHDLLQMDDEWLNKLPADLLLEVSKRLLHDVKALQDRLNQRPTNSSRPPNSRAPWEKPRDAAGEAGDAPVGNPPEAAAELATDAADSTAEPVKANVKPSSSSKASSKPRGKQLDSPGHGRTQKLAITDTCEHRPEESIHTQVLFVQVLERANLLRTLKQVRRNKGAPGIDGRTVDELPDYLLHHWLDIRAQLETDRYRPQPVKCVEIAKGDGKTRPF
jgi:hypothetical protein